MASPLYSAQLSAGTALLGTATTDTLIATVPVGVVWVLRDVELSVGPFSPSSFFSLYLRPASFASLIPLVVAQGFGNTLVQTSWEGRAVLGTGDEIRRQSGGFAGEEARWVISGYVLTAP